MTHRLVKADDVDTNSLVSDLEQLYQEVDLNGDGLMQWDEFTSFVIDAGMVSGKSQASMEQKRETAWRGRLQNPTAVNPLSVLSAQELYG